MSAAPRKKSALEGKKFRFVVKSAEEAVKVIREQLGENARVLSVEQVGGKGLARFLSAPQLEVIATVISKEEAQRERQQQTEEAAARRPAPKPRPSTATPEPSAQAPAEPAPTASPAQDRAAARAQRAAARRPGRPQRPGRPATAVPTASPHQPETTPEPPAAAPAKPVAKATLPATDQASSDPRLRQEDSPLTPSGKETLESLLHKARFDDELIGRIASQTDWARISKMQLQHGLSEVFCWLRQEYQKLEPKPIATRMAFMGTPGCGKTTALCKRMANDVFVHGKAIQVLKVEGESPNPDDALRVLCDILNVPLYRDPIDLDKVDPDGDLYIDVPGVPLHEYDQWAALAQRLDELYVESRVMVINAAYEKDAIKEMFALGERTGGTHQVFTHLDELANVTKLWQFILGSRLSTLFFSYGQNVTSEFTHDILEFMTSKTFPSYLTA